jgi:peptidoglycan/xylan/chitin deacetylase (PgdA/CDA1 family)
MIRSTGEWRAAVRVLMLKWVYSLRRPARDHAKIPVLCYHRVLPDSAAIRAPVYSISSENFEEHLKAIMRMGYRTVHLDDYIEHLKGNRPVGRKSILITFDDGFNDAFAIAWPVAKKYNAVLNLFITADENGALDEYYPRAALASVAHHIRKHGLLWQRIGWDDLRAMRAAGCGIGLHGYRHGRLTQFSLGAIDRQLGMSRSIFLEKLDHPLRAFAFPFGHLKDLRPEIVALLQRRGFDALFSTLPGRSRLPCMQGRLLSRIVIGQNETAETVVYRISGAEDALGILRNIQYSLTSAR